MNEPAPRKLRGAVGIAVALGIVATAAVVISMKLDPAIVVLVSTASWVIASTSTMPVDVLCIVAAMAWVAIFMRSHGEAATQATVDVGGITSDGTSMTIVTMLAMAAFSTLVIGRLGSDGTGGSCKDWSAGEAVAVPE
eukprot:6208294-Pleurochrysis_carterae.AAC.6